MRFCGRTFVRVIIIYKYNIISFPMKKINISIKNAVD
jgi:hypothetical protein